MVVSDSLCIGEFQKKIAITRNVFLSLEIYLSREKCVSKETDSALFCLSNLSPLDIRHCIFTWAFIVRFDWPSKAIFHFPKIISLRIQKNPLCHSLRSRKAESQNLISKKIPLFDWERGGRRRRWVRDWQLCIGKSLIRPVWHLFTMWGGLTL